VGVFDGRAVGVGTRVLGNVGLDIEVEVGVNIEFGVSSERVGIGVDKTSPSLVGRGVDRKGACLNGIKIRTIKMINTKTTIPIKMLITTACFKVTFAFIIPC